MYRWQKDRIREATITPWEIQEATAALFRERASAVIEFFEHGGADTIMPVELFVASGMPRCDGSASDDALRDQYMSAFQAVVSEFQAEYIDTITERIHAKREQDIWDAEDAA